MADDPDDTRRRSRGWPGSLAVVVVATVLATLGLQSLDLLPSLKNPFGTRTVDRTGPALLTSLTDLARFQASTGSFQVVVDVEQDVRLVPSAIAGERALYVAVGTVDGYVDFAQLDDDAVVVSDDGRRVDVVLPPADLTDARVDVEQSQVFSRDRGLLNRLGGVFSDDPTSERELILEAEERMLDAAQDGGLRELAETNTREMLSGLLGSLGYSDVRVEFSQDVRP